MSLYTDAGAIAAGVAVAMGWRKLRPEREKLKAQGEALAVDTLRDVVITLRDELERVHNQLTVAEALIVKLTGKGLPPCPYLTSP